MFNIFKRKKPYYQGEKKDYPYFYREEIEKYYLLLKERGSQFYLSDQSCIDFTFEDFFRFADRTTSAPGQQYLYHQMRSVPGESNPVTDHESLIQTFSINKELCKKTGKILSGLESPDAYGIISLTGKTYEEPKGYFLFRILTFVPILLIVLLYFFPSGYTWLLAISSIILNGFFHYRNKPNTWGFLSSMPQLVKLINVSEKLYRIDKLKKIDPDIPDALKTLNPIRQHRNILISEINHASELAMFEWFITELLHILFLTEPISYIKFIRLLKNKQQSIEQLFRFIGQVDTLLSVSYLRKDLPYYTIPGKTPEDIRIQGTGIYHPLIPDCVSNDLVIKEKSVLLTGTNMSGKTTFIRTIGLNLLAAQNLNTAFAKELALVRPLKITSALMLSDSLAESTSSYLQEVKAIREMLIDSNKEQLNLFLLDEVFKGTNTTERIAAAKAVLRNLNKKNNIVFVSTHDMELADLLEKEYDLFHFSETLENEQLSFDYKLKEGKLKTRNAIRILEISGYPEEVIREAGETYEYLAGFHFNSK